MPPLVYAGSSYTKGGAGKPTQLAEELADSRLDAVARAQFLNFFVKHINYLL